MTKLLFLAALSGVLFYCGCANSKQTKVDYTVISGYFVRNDVQNATLVEKITSQEAFSEYFGMGATMSQTPSPIDFGKELVVAVILPLTDYATEITVDSLFLQDGKLDLYYSVHTGGRQSYTMRPFYAVKVGREHDGELNATVNDLGSVGDVVMLDVKDGRASATVHKESGQSVTFAFASGGYSKLSGRLCSGDTVANVRFSQIIMPDGSADGPFGREIVYDLTLEGVYNLIVNENMMAGDPWAGKFTIEIELTK